MSDRPADQYGKNPRMRGRSVPSPAPRVPMLPREERLKLTPPPVSVDPIVVIPEIVIEDEEIKNNG